MATILKETVKAKVVVTILQPVVELQPVVAKVKHIRARVKLLGHALLKTLSPGPNQTEFEMIQYKEPERVSK